MLLHPLLEEWDVDVWGDDPLGFPDYRQRLDDAEAEAVCTGRTAHYALVASRFEVFGGSMGAAVGERVVRAYRRATDLRLPLVAVTRSGGARMQEGMVALVQMARTADAARRHGEAGLLSLAVHRSPSTGGVLASYSSLCDVRAAERGATVGFAGPRVVEHTVGVALPEGSHTAESAYDHGLVDALVDRNSAVAWVEAALGRRDVRLPTRPLPAWTDPGGEGAWAEVQRARVTGRPTGIDRAARLCSSWTDLRGMDPTVRAGLATVAGRRAVVLATDRYAGTGRLQPDGFRLAQRAIALAGRLGLPLVSLVDTPGADPGPEAEADQVAREIARTFSAMAALSTPSVAVCVGEGGSGGALALSFADRFLMQEHAVFSVIGPEGAASILHRDPERAPEVAEALKLTSHDLVGLGVVDAVVPEGQGALERAVADALDQAEPGQRHARFNAATERWLS